jgi:hypothetical protein
MITRGKKAIALTLAFTLFALLGLSTVPLPAAGVAGAVEASSPASADSAPQAVEREMQAGVKLEKKKILPVILIGAAAVAGIFLLVMLVSKVKYDISGTWDFRNSFTTAGQIDFDSVWTFTAFDSLNPVQGTYVRKVNGVTVGSGSFTVLNKKDVVFYGSSYEEEYQGQFDGKKTMSGTFTLISTAKGSWTATKR